MTYSEAEIIVEVKYAEGAIKFIRENKNSGPEEMTFADIMENLIKIIKDQKEEIEYWDSQYRYEVSMAASMS